MKRGRQGEGGGRPPLVFDEKQLGLLEGLSGYLTIAQIADRIGVSDRGFRNAMERLPDVKDAVKRGKARKIEAVAESLFQKATSGGNVVAAIFYLKAQAGWKDDGSGQEEPQPLTINLVQPDGTTRELQPINDKAPREPTEA
jgi:hypothetical protein